MIAAGLIGGERLAAWQWAGFLLALAGMAALTAPGVSAPPPLSAALMLGAGAAWGAYSMLGRGNADPLGATAGNFLRALPVTALLFAMTGHIGQITLAGFGYAALSGAVTSGLGYAVWYAALPGLSAAQGASVQLSVPVITALAGAAALGEAITVQLAASSAAVLGGIALVIIGRKHAP